MSVSSKYPQISKFIGLKFYKLKPYCKVSLLVEQEKFVVVFVGLPNKTHWVFRVSVRVYTSWIQRKKAVKGETVTVCYGGCIVCTCVSVSSERRMLRR